MSREAAQIVSRSIGRGMPRLSHCAERFGEAIADLASVGLGRQRQQPSRQRQRSTQRWTDSHAPQSNLVTMVASRSLSSDAHSRDPVGAMTIEVGIIADPPS